MSAVQTTRRAKSPRPSFNDDPPPFPVRRFTVDEYHRLIDAGILKDGDPYELLDGWITRKMTKNPPHEVCLRLLHTILGVQIPTDWMYDSQLALSLSSSEPEPDGMIVKGAPRDYISRHPKPKDIALVIEAAESSLMVDRAKAELYARDGIPRYWLINLVDRVIEDFSQPIGRGQTARYKVVRTVTADETISLTLGRKTLSFTVADVLP